MKHFILITAFLFCITAFAQKNKTASGGSSASSTAAYSYSNSELIATLGMVHSALNLGAQYNKLASNDLGLGGYVFLQTDKENNSVKVVYQTLSLGGQMKASLVQNSNYEAYLSPGVGLHMVKDYPEGANKSDLTAIGPTLRIGVLKTLSPTMKLGLERFEMWNWLDTKGPDAGVAYSAALSIEM